MSILLCVSLIMHVGYCQGFPDIWVFPSQGPVVVGCLEQTVATCIVAAAKQNVTIAWRTDDLPHSVEETETRHDNGTATTRSELKMIPKWKMYRMNVKCIVVLDGMFKDERTFTMQNIHFAPHMVIIEDFSHGDASLHFLCHCEANPPAEYSWRRGDQVIASSSSIILPRDAEPAVYTCEVKNYLGVTTKNLKIETRH
ncbi:nectin-3-like protein [Bufo gargarizans]|uniref:nectin-3-like protein n=1 Tax=Bufo gargarizans TaxID=30331 RepID=UPI001CF5D069|nr:nectin-3-like protein [Bufo gargarizans]